MPTTATSHRTRATLHQVALSHANSRTLSLTTREYFRRILEGDIDVNDGATLQGLEGAFFEAALSLSTRYGQSYARRCHGSDLTALREAVYAGQSIAPATITYAVTFSADDAERFTALREALDNFDHDGVKSTAVALVNYHNPKG